MALATFFLLMLLCVGMGTMAESLRGDIAQQLRSAQTTQCTANPIVGGSCTLGMNSACACEYDQVRTFCAADTPGYPTDPNGVYTCRTLLARWEPCTWDWQCGWMKIVPKYDQTRNVWLQLLAPCDYLTEPSNCLSRDTCLSMASGERVCRRESM